VYRHLKYLTRPLILAADADRKAVGLPDRHQHPDFRRLPPAGKYPIIFAHPNYTERAMRALVLFEAKGLSWWMDIPFERYRRLPHTVVSADSYRW